MPINSNDKSSYILPVAIAVGGYVVLDKLGLFGNHRPDQTGKIKVDESKLPGDPTKYANIADIQYNAMNAYGTDTSALFNSLKGLDANELKAVAKAFGKRASTISIIPGTEQSISGNRTIFDWYNTELWEWTGNLDKMKAIWKNTGLW